MEKQKHCGRYHLLEGMCRDKQNAYITGGGNKCVCLGKDRILPVKICPQFLWVIIVVEYLLAIYDNFQFGNCFVRSLTCLCQSFNQEDVSCWLDLSTF